MKKALAILMVLAMVAGAAFAADPYGNMAAVAVEGDATLTWGYNFDSPMRNGFKNEANWKISIPLLAKQNFTTKSEGDSYAEISIVDAQYNIVGEDGDKSGFTGGDKKIDKVTAKLVFGNVYVNIYGAPGFKVNNAEIWKTIKNDGYFDDGKEGKNMRFEPGFDGVGTKVGYKTDKFDVGVKLASKLAYDDTGAKDATAGTYVIYVNGATAKTLVAADVGKYLDMDGAPLAAGDVIAPGQTYILYTAGAAAVPAVRKSQYAFGIDASVTPSDMISASATFNYANWNATRAIEYITINNVQNQPSPVTGFMSAGFKATVKPIADLEIVAALDAGNDYMTLKDVNSTTVPNLPEQIWAFDAIATAKYKFVEGGVYYGSVGTAFEGLDSTKPDVTVANPKMQNPAGTISVYAKVTDGDFVENLDAAFTVMAYAINNTIWYDSDNTAAVKLDKYSNPIAASLTASYKVVMNDVNYFKPGFELFAQSGYDPASKSYAPSKDNEFALAYNVYADYGLFTNTTITAKYAKGATQDNKLAGLVKTASRTTDGVFTLACKVKY